MNNKYVLTVVCLVYRRFIKKFLCLAQRFLNTDSVLDEMDYGSSCNLSPQLIFLPGR